MSVAEVRANVQRLEGDIAVVAEMDVVTGIASCASFARGCTRLPWSAPDGETDVRLQPLPFASIRRVLHVVPDFADLVRRRGCDAGPAGRNEPVAERLAMRFFVNAVYRWGGGGE